MSYFEPDKRVFVDNIKIKIIETPENNWDTGNSNN